MLQRFNEVYARLLLVFDNVVQFLPSLSKNLVIPDPRAWHLPQTPNLWLYFRELTNAIHILAAFVYPGQANMAYRLC